MDTGTQALLSQVESWVESDMEDGLLDDSRTLLEEGYIEVVKDGVMYKISVEKMG